MIAVLLGWPAISACTKEESLHPDPLPVVEGYLAPGQTTVVRVTREITYGSVDTAVALANLALRIIHGDQSYSLEETAPGEYTSDDLPVIPGDRYRLSFEYNGREITAITTVPQSPGAVTASATDIAVPQFGSGSGAELPDPIRYTWHNPEQAYHLLVVKNVEPNPQPITFNLGDDVIEKPEPAFRLPPHRGDSQQLSIGRFSYYGEHAVILYRIQPEYAALYESNGSNSTDLVAPPTNVEGGLGIFTAVHAADTLWVQVW